MDAKLVLEYTRGLKVLYVEDDAAVANETKLLLEEFFDTVTHAEDGLIGLKFYKEYHKDIDLVISDINMPNLNGIEMSRTILALDHDQKIIVISAHNESDNLYDLINLGVERFILKPIRQKQLLRVLYSVCKGIVNFKLVSQYFSEIAELNLALEEKNKILEEQNKSLLRSERVFETNIKKDNFSKYIVKLKNKQVFSSDDPVADSANNKQVNSKQANTDVKELNEIAVMIKDDLPELSELYLEMEALVIMMISNGERSNIEKLSELIGRYSTILSGYYVFFELSNALLRLSKLLQEEPLPENEEQVKNIFLILESFLYTLQRWQQDWVQDKVKNANFFDDSLISDIETIINLWTNCQDYDEIEFF